MSEVPAETPRRKTSQHWFAVWCAALLPLGIAAMAVFFEPDPRGFGTHEQLGVRPCSMMELWDVPCPGCGVTTSVTLASHGRLWDSFVAQPFGLFLVLLAGVFCSWSLVGLFRGRDLGLAFVALPHRAILTVVVAVALVSWLYKWSVT